MNKAKLALMTACVLLVATAVANASPYEVTLEQVGSNVVATGSGAINLIGLSFDETSEFYSSDMRPATPVQIFTGGTACSPYCPVEIYTGAITGPTNFGSGSLVDGSGSGANVGIQVFASTYISVPLNYESDSVLSDMATYESATFASLGITPGTYVWTWGSGADQSFTLDAIAPTPLPATLPLFATGLGALGLFGARRERKVQPFTA